MYSLSLKATDDVHYLWLLWMDTTSPRFPAISPRKPWVLKFQPPCGRGRSFQRRSQPWHAHIAPPWMSTLFILTFEQHIYKNCTTLHLCFCCCCCQSQTKNPSVKRSQVELQQLWWQEAPARHAMGHQSIRRKGLGVLSALSFHSGGALQAEMRKSATANGMMVWDISMLQHWHECSRKKWLPNFEVKTSSSRHALSSLPMYRRW